MKRVTMLGLFGLVLAMSGCATDRYVEGQVDPLADRLTKVEGKVNALETRLTSDEAKLEQYHAQDGAKADRAVELAGKAEGEARDALAAANKGEAAAQSADQAAKEAEKEAKKAEKIFRLDQKK